MVKKAGSAPFYDDLVGNKNSPPLVGGEKGEGGINLKRGRNKVVEKLNLNMPHLLKRYAWAALLLVLVALFFQAPAVWSAGEGERKAEDIKGSVSLEAVSREWGIPAAYLIEGLKLPKDVPLNLALK
jgi:hypothetical protein